MTSPTADIHDDKILILDFGSQYTQLIARRIREVGVYCEIMPWDTDEADIRAFVPSGIILSGGPESVTVTDSPRAPDIVFTLDVPLLGICYGMQTMAAQLGGGVEGSDTSEFGYAQIRRTSPGGLFADLADQTDDSKRQLLDVWMSHGDKVSQLPPDFERIAETDSCPIAGMAHVNKPWFGIQFHPEVTHTTQGENIFAHFVKQICACEALWTPANIVEDAIRHGLCQFEVVHPAQNHDRVVDEVGAVDQVVGELLRLRGHLVGGLADAVRAHHLGRLRILGQARRVP